MKEDDVVVVSSDSEEDEEIVWKRKNQNKQYQLLSEKIKPILYYQVQPGYKLSTSFPYAKFQELANDLKKSLALVNVKSTQAFIWKNLIRWLVSLKLCYENVSDCINDRNYNLILTDFMAQYVNYKCQLYSSITDETEVGLISNEIVVTLSLVFSGWVPGILMTLLKIQVIDDYQLILYPIFRKYLSNKHLHESSDFISYLRLILCFRKWKKLAHLKEDKEIINEIAVGKSAKALRSDIIDLSTETAGLDPVLPKTVPSVNEDNRTFANITGLIGFASKNREFGTRILLINKTLELDDTIEQFFNRYNEYINRSSSKLLECSRADFKPTLIEDLTRSPSPDQHLSRPSCAIRESSQIANKNKNNGKQGTKAVYQHLSNNCDISSISVNNKFNHLNLNSHKIENLGLSCKNIPQNRNNDVVLSLRINNVVDIDDTNDEDDNNEQNTCESGKNSNANSMNAFEKRIADALDRLKNRAIIVGDLVNRVNVERRNNPVVAAISSDETDQSNIEIPVVQAASNNVEAPISNPVPMCASVNLPNAVPVEKPIRKRHGIVSSTTSFEGTGDDSDNSDDDDGFGVHSRFPFSQRSFYKVVEEATSSTNEIPKTPSNVANQQRRSISSSPCPTRPSSPSPDRWSNTSPSRTIRSECLSRLGIAAGTSITPERTVSCITDGEQPTCSRYVAIPVSAANLPNHDDTSKKERIRDPSLEKPTLIDKDSATSINIIETSASVNEKSKSREDQCIPIAVTSDHKRTEVSINDKLTAVSEVDTNTCAVNELLNNISGYIGDLQDGYGFESSKNKCGPDKSPAVLSEKPTIVENGSNNNASYMKIKAHLSQSEAKKQWNDVEKTTKKSGVEEQAEALQKLNVFQQPTVLLEAKNDLTNTKDKKEVIKFIGNSTEITIEETSTEEDPNEENAKESFIDKPAVDEPIADINLPEPNTDKPTDSEVFTTLEDSKVQKQPSELLKAENSFKSINEEITNKINFTEEYSNIKHNEIVDKMSKTQVENSKPFADDEILMEAIVEDESSVDDIESPPYELICQNESLDTLDIFVQKVNNEEKCIENHDCKKTFEQIVLKDTKNVDQSVEETSEDDKDVSSENTAEKELKNTNIDDIECQLQHLEEENKRNTREKVIRNVSENHVKPSCQKIFEAEETVLAKNENMSDNRPQIFIKTVELNQKQVNTNNFPKSSEDEKLKIEEIINSDHDYVTVKYSDSSSRNDQAYDKLEKLQNFNDNSKACIPMEFDIASETGHNYSHQILETFNANKIIVSKQENKSNDREINEISKLQILEKEENSYEDTHEQVNDDFQKDQGFENLTVIYDTILTTCQTDDQQDQEGEKEDVNNQSIQKCANSDQSKQIRFSVNHIEAIENQTYDHVSGNRLLERPKSCDEILNDKTDETLDNQTSDPKEIVDDLTPIHTELNFENKLTIIDEGDTENPDIMKTLNICPSINQNDRIIEKQGSYVKDIGESVVNKVAYDTSIIPIDIKLHDEKSKEDGENEEPLNTSKVIDHKDETKDQQTIDDTEINEGQSFVDNITPIDTQSIAEVTVNIEDENEYKKEPLNISQAIDRNETFCEHELTDISKDHTKDEVSMQPLKIIPVIYKSNKESMQKQTSDAKEFEEDQSVIQQMSSDKNATTVDTEFDDQNALTITTDTIKVNPKIPQIDEIIEGQTSKVKNSNDEITYGRSVTPVCNKHNVGKDTGNLFYKEPLNTSPSVAQKEKPKEKQMVDIKETHEGQSYPEQKTSKENVKPTHIQHQNETTADNKHHLENCSETEPPKLPIAIEHKVIFETTNTQDTLSVEIINDDILGSFSPTKNVSKMQTSSSSSSKVVSNDLEVLTTQERTSPLPPKVIDTPLNDQIRQDKTLVLSLSPSSESINKSQPSQSHTINNETNSSFKDDSKRRLIIRIAKLPLLENELFKRSKGTGSVFKTVTLEEQKPKLLTNEENFSSYPIKEESKSEKNVLKKNKSSTKSERKKIKKAKKQALLLKIFEDEEVKAPINLPIKDSKITREEDVIFTKEIAAAVCEEKMRAKTSIKKRKKEEKQKLTKPPKDSKLLPEDQVLKLNTVRNHQTIDDKKTAYYVKEKTEDQINSDKSVAAIYTELNDTDKDNIQIKKPKYTGSLILCLASDQKDKSIQKQTSDVEKVGEDQSVASKLYSEKNASAIDTEIHAKRDTENDHKKPLNTSLSIDQKDEAIDKRTLDVAEIHKNQSRSGQKTSNETPIYTQDQDETTADGEHCLEKKDKKEPLKVSAAIKQKINVSNTNTQDTCIKECSANNYHHERENKMEIINDEIHNSINSFPSSNVLNVYSEELKTEVKSSFLSPKGVDVKTFETNKEQRKEEKQQGTSFHQEVLSMPSSESFYKSGNSQYQKINDEVHSPIKDEPLKKLIIRIPKLPESAETASVSKTLTLKIQKHLKHEETSGKHKIAQQKSPNDNKSSKKSDHNKINVNKINPVLKSKLVPEDQVCEWDTSECISIQADNTNTATEKNQYEKYKLKLSIESANEHTFPAKEDIKEAATEISAEGVGKPHGKISTKKKKTVTFEIQGVIDKPKHPLQSNIFKKQVKTSIQIPTKDLKLSKKEQALKLDASKCLASIESNDIKHDLDKSVVYPVAIEENKIFRNNTLKIFTNKRSDTNTKQVAISRTNKPKHPLKAKKEVIDELIKLPPKDSISSPGDDQVIKLNASECVRINQKSITEGNVDKGLSEKNKPKQTVENVIERKSFVKTILEEYMKESAVKKNTTSSVAIPKTSLQQERNQKLNSKQSIETSIEEPILKKTKTPNEAHNSYEPTKTPTLSISKPSTEIEILEKPKGVNDRRSASLDTFAKTVKFAECQTEPKSTIEKHDEPCSSKCRTFSDASSIAQLNPNKWQTSGLQNIIQCKDELIKNRNQEVFSQISHAKQENSIEPDSSSQVAKELQRTENTLTEEESNLSTRVQVADLGEPSLISDSEISLQNASVTLESDKSIVFYPSRDSAEDQEVSCITSQKNDNTVIYYNNNDDGTPVLDEKNSTEDESPSNHCKITSLSKIVVPTADEHQLTSLLLSQKPQLIEPIPQPPHSEPKEHEFEAISNDNDRSDELATPIWGAADENLELWLKKLGISKNCALNRGTNVPNSNSTKLSENSLENQKNDRKQKKPQRVEKSLNFEDFNAAAILTSLKARQKKVHRCRKALQPTRITRSASQIAETETLLQHDSRQSFSENLCEKDPLDNLKIIQECRIPSSVQNNSELTQSNGSSDSDDTGKLVIDLDAKRLTKPKANEKQKSKKNKNGKGTTSPKPELKTNKKAKKKLSFNPIVEFIDESPCILKRCRGRPRVSKDLTTKNPQATTPTRSRRGIAKQKKKNKEMDAEIDEFAESFEESKTPVERNKQVVDKKSLKRIDPEKKDKLRLGICDPEDLAFTEKRNEEPCISSNYKSSSCTATPHNMNQETWLKNLTLRKTSKSLDSVVKPSSENVSMVKKILSEQNLLQISKTDVGVLNIKPEESETVSEILIETIKAEDGLNKPKHDIREETKEMKTLKAHKQPKGDKLNRCIRRLSIEEKQPKKPRIENEEPTTLKDHTASITTPTLKTRRVKELEQSDASSETVKSAPNSIFESTIHSDLEPENKTVSIPDTIIDEKVVNNEQKIKKVQEVKNIEQIKSIVETAEISSLNEVETQVKTTPKNAISKIVDLMESEDTKAMPSRFSTLNEVPGKPDMDSNDVNAKEKPKSHKRVLNFDSPPPSDPSFSIIANTAPVDQPNKGLSSVEEVKLKSSVFSNAELEATLSTIVGPKKHRSKSSCENLKKNKTLDEQCFLDKRLRRLSLDSLLSQKNISAIEIDVKNLKKFAKVSKSSPVKTPTKKEDEVKRVLDISISNILGTQLSNVSESDSINIVADEGTKQENNYQSVKVDNEQIIKKSGETFSKRKRPFLDGVQSLANVSVFSRRRSNSTSDLPNTLPSEAIEVEGSEKDQETLKNKSESEAKKVRVLSFTNFLELERDFFLDELNGENFNDTREDQSSQVPVTIKTEPQQSVQSSDCMFSGNRGQDDEDKLHIFNTHLALEPVPTYSPDENVDLYPFDDLYSLLPTSTLINGSENVSGSSSESGEKTKSDNKKAEFTPKDVETEKATFEEVKSSTIGEKRIIDVTTSEYELNNCTTNISSAEVILINPPQVITSVKTKPIKCPVVKIFPQTTPEKKILTEETTESILGSKLKSRQKPFWKQIQTLTKPKVVEEISESTKFDTSTSVISSAENHYPIDDVKSLPVYLDNIFEEEQTKTPLKSENIVTESNSFKVDLSKTSFLTNLSTDDPFDRIKNEGPVNTCVNKTPKPSVFKHSSSIKSDVNPSSDLCTRQLDEPKTQSISLVSSLSSISTKLCEQKDEANKSLPLIHQKNLYSNNSSQKKTDETQKTVLKSKSLKNPCLLKEIDETKKSCEQTDEADTLLHEDNNSYFKKPKRQSRIPSVKNSPEKVFVSQINEDEIFEKKTSSEHLTSRIRPSATVVSSMPSISSSLVTPTISKPCEVKISGKVLCSKKSIKHSLAIQSPDQSEKINPTQLPPENKTVEALQQYPLFSDAKKELPSKDSCSELSATSVSAAVVSSIPSISTSSGTSRILDRCDDNISGKASCSKKLVEQSFAIKTLDPSEKINETQLAPENKNVASSKSSLKRISPFSDVKTVQGPPCKMFCTEISATSIPGAVVPSMASISTSLVTPTIFDASEHNIAGKTLCSKKPLKQSMVIKTPDPLVKTNEVQPTTESKNVEASKASLKRYPSFNDATKVHEHLSKISRSENSPTAVSLRQQNSPTPLTLSKSPYCNLTTSSPNTSNAIAHARNQTSTKPAMLKTTSSSTLITNPPLPSQKSNKVILQPSVNLRSQSPRNPRTIPPATILPTTMHTTEKAVSFTFPKSTTPSSRYGKTYSDKPASTPKLFGTPRSNNIPSSTPRSTSSIPSTSATGAPSSWCSEVARLSAELEKIIKDVSNLPKVDTCFPDYRRRKALLKDLETKQEELNELKKKQQQHLKQTHFSKSYSERKPFDGDHKQHHHQHRSSMQQSNDLKRKHDYSRPHSEHQCSKGSTSGHSSLVERQKKPNQVYVNKFSELDKFNFTNRNDQSADIKPEVKKLPPWDPKPSNADEIIRTLRRK